MQILRKFRGKEVNNHIETVRNDYFKRELLTDAELDILEDMYDDPEESNDAGIWFDRNEDLAFIELDTLFDLLDEFINDKDNEDLSVIDQIKEMVKKIEPWRTYTLYFEIEKKKEVKA